MVGFLRSKSLPGPKNGSRDVEKTDHSGSSARDLGAWLVNCGSKILADSSNGSAAPGGDQPGLAGQGRGGGKATDAHIQLRRVHAHPNCLLPRCRSSPRGSFVECTPVCPATPRCDLEPLAQDSLSLQPSGWICSWVSLLGRGVSHLQSGVPGLVSHSLTSQTCFFTRSLLPQGTSSFTGLGL